MVLPRLCLMLCDTTKPNYANLFPERFAFLALRQAPTQRYSAVSTNPVYSALRLPSVWLVILPAPHAGIGLKSRLHSLIARLEVQLIC